MITAVLLIVCILSSGLSGNLYHKLAAKSQRVASAALMPSVWFFLLAVIFSVAAWREWHTLTASAAVIALIAGICIFAAAFTLIESMKTGAFSVSVIIINLNFIIPVLLSTIILREKASLLQLFGMLLSVVVILLTNLGTRNTSVSSRKSVWLALIACIANGCVNFLIKVNEAGSTSANCFFVLMYAGASLCGGMTALALHPKARAKELVSNKKAIQSCVPYLLLMALCNGVCFYGTGMLAGRMNAAAQFTIVTGASIMLSLFVGFVFQGDRFEKKTAVSILFCILTILCQ